MVFDWNPDLKQIRRSVFAYPFFESRALGWLPLVEPIHKQQVQNWTATSPWDSADDHPSYSVKKNQKDKVLRRHESAFAEREDLVGDLHRFYSGRTSDVRLRTQEECRGHPIHLQVWIAGYQVHEDIRDCAKVETTLRPPHDNYEVERPDQWRFRGRAQKVCAREKL